MVGSLTRVIAECNNFCTLIVHEGLMERNDICIKTENLTALVRAAHLESTATVEALCIDVCGGHVDAGRMLHRLFAWWPFSKQEDGSVYKSYTDWWSELRIAQGRLTGAKTALRLAGVIDTVRRVAGVPTTHYRLDAEVFIERLTKVLRTAITQVRAWLSLPQATPPNDDFRNGQIDHFEMSESAISRTTVLTKELQTNTLVGTETPESGDDLAAGETRDATGEGRDQEPVPDVVRDVFQCDDARRLIRRHGVERVCEVVRESDRPNVKDRSAWSLAALANGWQMRLPEIKPVAQKRSGDDYAGGKYAAWLLQETDVPSWRPMPSADERRQERETKLRDMGEGLRRTNDDFARWDTARNQLEAQLDSGQWETYLRRVDFVGIDGETWVLAVSNPYARDHVAGRLSKLVRRVLSDVAGREVEIRVECPEEVGV
jgi:hypothetical protein